MLPQEIFSQIPIEAIEFARNVFNQANDDVSRLLTIQPSMHEEGLDFALIGALQKVGTRILPNTRVAVQIDAHWLGGRALYGRWEIADIALIVMVRVDGRLFARKVALIQSKRLYSDEVSGEELREDDYKIGIGRLVDRTDAHSPLARSRAFSFTEVSKYRELDSKSEQVQRIDAYAIKRDIPVYYNLYNPVNLPIYLTFPWPADKALRRQNKLGCRVMPREEVHNVLRAVNGSPKFKELIGRVRRGNSPFARHGWRLENFVADEILMCREGRLFGAAEHVDLQAMLYERSAPIASAVTITFDLPASILG